MDQNNQGAAVSNPPFQTGGASMSAVRFMDFATKTLGLFSSAD
jgi:hypothetical protein